MEQNVLFWGLVCFALGLVVFCELRALATKVRRLEGNGLEPFFLRLTSILVLVTFLAFGVLRLGSTGEILSVGREGDLIVPSGTIMSSLCLREGSWGRLDEDTILLNPVLWLTGQKRVRVLKTVAIPGVIPLEDGRSLGYCLLVGLQDNPWAEYGIWKAVNEKTETVWNRKHPGFVSWVPVVSPFCDLSQMKGEGLDLEHIAEDDPTAHNLLGIVKGFIDPKLTSLNLEVTGVKMVVFPSPTEE